MRSSNTTSIYRPDLGIAVMEFVEAADMGLIGLQIMPIWPVPDKSATFPVIPKEALGKIPDTARAPRGEYNRGDWKYEEGKYDCSSEHGWEEPIDDTERAMLERRSPGVADFVATQRAMKIILKAQERRIASTLFNEVNFSAHAVTNEWDDAVNATPITDVDAGIAAFRKQCGMLPDALVISYDTFRNLRQVAQIVDRIKYTFPGIDIANMTPQQLAQCLGVNRLLIGGAMYDSAGKNIAASMADIWDHEYAALVKLAPRAGNFAADITEPCVGYTFLWSDDSAENPVVEQYREDKIRSDVFRVRHNTDERLLRSYNSAGAVVSDIAASCVYLFSNITT